MARDEGIAVISDRLIDTDAIDYYVTFDSVAVGEAMGQYLVDNVEGKDNPLYLYAGALTDNNAFLFFQGMEHPPAEDCRWHLPDYQPGLGNLRKSGSHQGPTSSYYR